jgi:hypothetical protein
MELLLFTVGVLWAAPIAIASHLGDSRGRRGWMWGFFLGWLGVFIVALMRPLQLHEQVANGRVLEETRLRQLEQQNQQLLAELDARPRKP